jgi:hypothetical protein
MPYTEYMLLNLPNGCSGQLGYKFYIFRNFEPGQPVFAEGNDLFFRNLFILL